MKKTSVLAAVFCLLLATTAFAQEKAANFAGTWELDTAKSKLPERMRVESGTLTVTQTDKTLSVATDFKRIPPPEGQSGAAPSDGGNRGMRPGGMGGGRGGMMGGGNGTVSYSLDGKETTVESEAPSGAPSSNTTLKAKIEKDGKLKLTSTRTINGQMGEMTITTRETWELLDGGKTLKITRDTETPRGTQTAEMYFTKKVLIQGQTIQAPVVSENGTVIFRTAAADGRKSSTDAPVNEVEPAPKTINGGILNGKALVLAQPEYPKKARKEKAGGTVSVQIVIDENGNVVSAKAVSGNPLLTGTCIEAAKNSKFSPTTLSGAPVRVTGIITYNFIL